MAIIKKLQSTHKVYHCVVYYIIIRMFSVLFYTSQCSLPGENTLHSITSTSVQGPCNANIIFIPKHQFLHTAHRHALTASAPLIENRDDADA